MRKRGYLGLYDSTRTIGIDTPNLGDTLTATVMVLDDKHIEIRMVNQTEKFKMFWEAQFKTATETDTPRDDAMLAEIKDIPETIIIQAKMSIDRLLEIVPREELNFVIYELFHKAKDPSYQYIAETKGPGLSSINSLPYLEEVALVDDNGSIKHMFADAVVAMIKLDGLQGFKIINPFAEEKKIRESEPKLVEPVSAEEMEDIFKRMDEALKNKRKKFLFGRFQIAVEDGDIQPGDILILKVKDEKPELEGEFKAEFLRFDSQKHPSMIYIKVAGSDKEELVWGKNIVSYEKDTAMAAKGGIDLNPTIGKMNIQMDGNGVAVPFSQQPIEVFNIEGLHPVIMNVTPLNNALPFISGLVKKPEEPQRVGDYPKNKYFDITRNHEYLS